jgi:glycosidase
MNDDWYDGVPEYPEYPGGFVRNNMFFGGTLWGVIEKLDYLKSLGVNFIYLNPIFEAYSNHKYDTGDYTKIDPMFGGEEAFDALISAAKKKGIGVILDGVFNHTGSDSVYFNKNNRYSEPGAYNSNDSRYFDWYMFKNYPDDYESWWGIEILPKINGDNKEFRKFICGENGIIRRYLKRGIYGWRLDVADELKEDMLCDIRTALKSEKDGVLIGEVWEDASNKVAYDRRRRYFRGSELDSVMNYPLKNAVVEYLKSSDASGIAKITTELYSHYPKAVSDVLMNFLGTHDTERILTVLAGEDISGKTNAELASYRMSDENRRKAIELLKTAYLIIATMPGVPCIYYGDEAGLEGARDPFNRLPYPWGKENKELVEWYKKIGEIRQREKVFAQGYYKVRESTGGILVYDRFDKDTKITVIINRGNEDYTVSSKEEHTSLLSGTVSTTHTVKPGCADIIK